MNRDVRLLCHMIFASMFFASPIVIAGEPQGSRDSIRPGNAASPSYVTTIRGDIEPEKISYTTSAFYYYMQVADRQEPESARDELRREFRLDPTSADTFLNYIKATVRDSMAHAVTLSKALCERQQQLTTVAQLADAMSDVDSQILSYRQKRIAESELIIGTQAKEAFDQKVMSSNRRNLTVVVTDYRRWLTDTGQDPRAVLAKNCSTLLNMQ